VRDHWGVTPMEALRCGNARIVMVYFSVAASDDGCQAQAREDERRLNVAEGQRYSWVRSIKRPYSRKFRSKWKAWVILRRFITAKLVAAAASTTGD